MGFLRSITRRFFPKPRRYPWVNDQIPAQAAAKAKLEKPMVGDEKRCRCPHEDCHFMNEWVLVDTGFRAYHEPSVVRPCYQCKRLVLYLTEWRSGTVTTKAYRFFLAG